MEPIIFEQKDKLFSFVFFDEYKGEHKNYYITINNDMKAYSTFGRESEHYLKEGHYNLFSKESAEYQLLLKIASVFVETEMKKYITNLKELL